MKIKSFVLASGILMAATTFSATHAATEKSNIGESIKFVLDDSRVPNAGLVAYAFSVFSYNDLTNTFSGDNNNIDTFSPNQNGPYPGQIMTDGKLGVTVGVSRGFGSDDVCRVSLKSVLISDPKNGPMNFTSAGKTPTVKSESTKYACLAYLDGYQTVRIDVMPNS